MDAAAWDARYAGTKLLWSAEPNRFLASEAEGLAPGRALDLACGEGRNALWLAANGWQVVAVDFSAAGLDKGRRLAEAGATGVDVDWLLADVTIYEPPLAAFDLIVVLYLQLPRTALAGVLERAALALAPGGTVLAVGHDLTNLTDGYGGPQDPEVLWELDHLVASLPRLTVVKAERVDRLVETPDGQVVAIDALVRAVAPEAGDAPVRP